MKLKTYKNLKSINDKFITFNLHNILELFCQDLFKNKSGNLVIIPNIYKECQSKNVNYLHQKLTIKNFFFITYSLY